MYINFRLHDMQQNVQFNLYSSDILNLSQAANYTLYICSTNDPTNILPLSHTTSLLKSLSVLSNINMALSVLLKTVHNQSNISRT